MNLLHQVRRSISRYRMLNRGETVGLAVSGGADSLCLLHALLELRSELDLSLHVIHIDHNLRGDRSQADAQFVHNLAQRLSLPFHLRSLVLNTSRGNLEQEARRERSRFYRELIRGGIVHKVALGHTLSDQAETVLFRFLRGAGSAGLAGIRPVTESGLIRPLLHVTRPQVVAFLEERGVTWREDETNTQLRFDRNRIRHQLLPQLTAEWNPALTETLAQTAGWAFAEEQYWQSEISALAQKWVRFVNGSAVVEARCLNGLQVAVARRVIRYIVEQVKHDLLGVSFAHVEAVRDLAAGPGARRLQAAGVEVFRSFEWVRFVRQGEETESQFENWQLSVTPPGRYVLPTGTRNAAAESTLVLELDCKNGVYNSDVNALDWNKVGQAADGLLWLRNWRPGDHYQRQGHTGAAKLKRFFQEYRIPVWERQNWPVLAFGETIVWAKQFGPAAQFAVDADSRTVLRIHEISGPA